MFPFIEGTVPCRSSCLQSFKARRKNKTSTNNLIHVYAAKTRKYHNTLSSRTLSAKREQSNNFIEKEKPVIEEIDGVLFYRTTVPVVCESIRGNHIPRQKVRRSLKVREQPITIVVPEERHKTKPRTKKSRRLFDYIDPESFLTKGKGVFQDNMERKRRILNRLENDQENWSLSKIEEEEIHERAEFYSMSVRPDLKYISLPEDNFSHKEDPAYVASMWGQQLEYPLPKKRKSRNILTDSCYLSYHTPDDPYDNSQILPCGTRLYRPPDKLVELVADAIAESPDGLLQVPQIYTVLMNKYPYFRYMDKSAVTSWRSSVRHALFQKWFKKLKFITPDISSKGCFWCMNSQVDSSEIKNSARKKAEEDSLEDYDLDPNTHDTVIELLNEEEKDIGQFNSQVGNCSVKVPVYHFIAGEDNYVDPDPVLTTCTTTSNDNTKRQAIVPMSTKRKAILPVSLCPSVSPYSDLSNSSSSPVSPLMNSVRPDTLGVDHQINSINLAVNWAPKLPFDHFLDRKIGNNSLSQQSDEVLVSGGYDFLNGDSIVPSASPDLSSGKSSPQIYNSWESCFDSKSEPPYCLNIDTGGTMNFQSDDSTDIGYIIPESIQWCLDETMPAAIFDKDGMSSQE